MGRVLGAREAGWRLESPSWEEGLIPFSCWLESEGEAGPALGLTARSMGNPAERVGRRGKGDMRAWQAP